MVYSQALVAYQPSPSLTSLFPVQTHGSLSTTGLFSATTGTAIATELLYRILLDIINRILHSLQNFASRRMDQFSSYLEQKALERREMRRANPPDEGNDEGDKVKKPGVMAEVKRMLNKKSTFDMTEHCPMGARGLTEGTLRRPAPPMWVESVLKGVDEGRMLERDFWIQTHGD